MAKSARPAPRTKPKPPPKLCPKGHRIAPRGSYCGKCEWERREEDERRAAASDRERWKAEMGPPPAELIIRDHTGAIVSSTALARPRRRR